MDLTLTWPELLIAVVLATLVYLLETMVLARRRGRQDSGGADGLNDRILQLQAEIEALRKRMDALERQSGAPAPESADEQHATYDYAVQYARQGMIAPEIAARCGISQDEAALIVALHRSGKKG